MRDVAFVVAVFLGVAPTVARQSPEPLQPAPAFEVTSVKRSDPNARGSLISGPAPQGFEAHNAPLTAIIQYAYRLAEYQLVDAPAWARSERFDIRTTYPDGNARDRVPEMVQSLLADRFSLRVHREVRQGPIFDLAIVRDDGRLGPKIRETDVDCVAFLAAQKAAGGRRLGSAGQPTCLMLVSDRYIKAGGRSIASLALTLARHVERRVVDRTGLTGEFDFDLEWSSEIGQAPAPGSASTPQASPDDNVSIYTALREQLGLELRSTTGPIDVVVVDSVQPPLAD